MEITAKVILDVCQQSMPVQAGISSEQPKLRVKNEMSNSTGRQNLSVSLRRGGNVDDDKVFQGLQKKQRCKLCEQEFFVDSLPGAISYNSVLKLRQKYVVVVVATSRNVTHSNHTVLLCTDGEKRYIFHRLPSDIKR